KRAGTIFQQRAHGRGPRDGQRLMAKSCRAFVERIETVVCRDPQRSALIFEQREDGVADETRGVTWIAAEACEMPCCLIEAREPCLACADPHLSAAGETERTNPVEARIERAVNAAGQRRELAGLRISSEHAATIRRDPENALGVALDVR